MRPGVRAIRARKRCTAISARETRPRRAGAAADAPRDAQRLLEHEPQARSAEPELESAFLAIANLADDLGLADAGRIEARRRQEQVFRGAFALPGAQAPLRFAVPRARGPSAVGTRRGASPGRRAVAARENELDAIARREIGELRELQALREILQLRRGLLLLQGRTRRALRCRLGATRRRPSPTVRATPVPTSRLDAQPSAAPGLSVTPVSRRRPIARNANRFRWPRAAADTYKLSLIRASEVNARAVSSSSAGNSARMPSASRSWPRVRAWLWALELS